MNSLENLVRFLGQAAKLKKTVRYGSADERLFESVADHSWRLSLMVYTFAEDLNLDLDVYKSIRMALIHDLGEYLEGDVDARLIADGKVTKEEKKGMELRAWDVIRETLSNAIGEEYFNLWREFEEKSTREAKYVNALDKLESLFHLLEIKKGYNYPDLIANYADEAVVEFPELKPLLGEVKRRLKLEYEKQGISWKPEYDLNF